MFLKRSFLFLVIGLCSGCGIPNYNAEKVERSLKGTPIISHTVNYNKRVLHYVTVENDNTSNLIVFIHGSPGGWEAYGDYLKDEELQSKATLMSVDRLGFGQSKNGGFESSVKTHASAIASAIMMHNTSKIVVVGHSYGGPVAARLLMDYPNLIDGIILAAPSISPEQEKRRWYNEVASWLAIRWLLPDNLDTSNREILPLKGELDAMRPLWKTIKQPVTVIQGDTDRLVPKENADFAQKVLINTTSNIIRIKNQGHFVIWEQYDLVKDNIVDMLDETHE